MLAAEALVAFPTLESIASLTAALGDRSEDVRIAAAKALTEAGALPPLGEVLPRLVQGGLRSRRLVEFFRCLPQDRLDELVHHAMGAEASAFVRAAAIDALSRSGNYGFLPVFEQAASDPSPEVAAAAIRALGSYGHPVSVKAVLRALSALD
jgi:HEAT repeat protein